MRMSNNHLSWNFCCRITPAYALCSRLRLYIANIIVVKCALSHNLFLGRGLCLLASSRQFRYYAVYFLNDSYTHDALTVIVKVLASSVLRLLIPLKAGLAA